jgi:hypothetical protein
MCEAEEHSGSAQATKLRSVTVFGCSELEELPSMESLVSLEHLPADGCVKLKNIRGWRRQQSLDPDHCIWVLRVTRAAKYGNIGIFGGVAGRRICEAEEHTGSAQATKLRLYLGNPNQKSWQVWKRCYLCSSSGQTDL